MSNKSNSPFFRRYGGYIFGGLMAAALVGIAVVGRSSNGSTDIKLRYYSYRMQQQFNEQNDHTDSQPEADSEPEMTQQEIYEAFYRLDDLGLRYEAHIIGFGTGTGALYYDVLFSGELPSGIKDRISEEIQKKCGKNVEDNLYGEVTVEEFRDENRVGITLNIERINTDKAITGIFKALNEIDGVVSATLDAKKDTASDTKADARTDSVADKLDQTFSEKYGIEELGLSFPVQFTSPLLVGKVTYKITLEDITEKFEVEVIHGSDEDSSDESEDESEADRSKYTMNKTGDNEITIEHISKDADSVENVTRLLKAINKNKGVVKVVIS